MARAAWQAVASRRGQGGHDAITGAVGVRNLCFCGCSLADGSFVVGAPTPSVGWIFVCPRQRCARMVRGPTSGDQRTHGGWSTEAFNSFYAIEYGLERASVLCHVVRRAEENYCRLFGLACRAPCKVDARSQLPWPTSFADPSALCSLFLSWHNAALAG